MAHAALTYAEQVLGVHTVHEQAVAARNSLDEALTRLSDARDRRRSLEHERDDLEQELISEEWSKHPDMAQTRFDKHIKGVYYRSDAWRELRSKLAEVQSEIDGLECDQRLYEQDIRIAASRLQELGGYLEYLAAVKRAESTERTGEQQ